jgi:hypothetical protein
MGSSIDLKLLMRRPVRDSTFDTVWLLIDIRSDAKPDHIPQLTQGIGIHVFCLIIFEQFSHARSTTFDGSTPCAHLLVDILDQDGPVSGSSSLDILNALSRLLHRPLGNPRLDVLVSSELKHSHDFRLGTNVRGTDKGAVTSHGLRSQSGPVGLGHTVPDELALRHQAADEFVEGKAGVGGGADDDVEAHGVLFGKVAGGSDKVLGSHLQSVVLLSLRMRKDLWARIKSQNEFDPQAVASLPTHSDFRSKGDGEEDSVVTETTLPSQCKHRAEEHQLVNLYSDLPVRRHQLWTPGRRCFGTTGWQR